MYRQDGLILRDGKGEENDFSEGWSLDFVGLGVGKVRKYWGCTILWRYKEKVRKAHFMRAAGYEVNAADRVLFKKTSFSLPGRIYAKFCGKYPATLKKIMIFCTEKRNTMILCYSIDTKSINIIFLRR